jgi:hypothetical protein
MQRPLPDRNGRAATLGGVRDSKAMIAGLTPLPDPAVHVFCTLAAAAVTPQLTTCARAMLREEEGVSLILSIQDATDLGLASTAPPMARITLGVQSALDGVGLMAAVATVLADQAIPCNMVAGFHHDHVFVLLDRAEDSLTALRELQTRGAP